MKTMKLMWKQISGVMLKEGFIVSAIQAENEFKTLERAYKLMLQENKKTGRGRTTCEYERLNLSLQASKTAPPTSAQHVPVTATTSQGNNSGASAGCFRQKNAKVTWYKQPLKVSLQNL